MIVYAEHEWTVGTREALASMRLRLAGLDDHAAKEWRDLLVDFGELEAGILDARFRERDDEDDVSRELSAAMLAVARGFREVSTGAVARDDAASLQARLARLEAAALPRAIRVHAPEGHSQYALYPETYVEAARRFVRAESPARVVCIGLRAAGTSLSAAVAAKLQSEGVPVERLTLRPRGHPHDRRLALTARLETRLLEITAGATCAIVDEGPGLSGSSFAAASRALGEMGVPDERIVLFPSGTPDGEAFLSESAREHWRRHRRYHVSFEEQFLTNGRLAEALEAPRLVDLSAG